MRARERRLLELADRLAAEWESLDREELVRRVADLLENTNPELMLDPTFIDQLLGELEDRRE